MSYALGLVCSKCGAEYPISKMYEGCPKCRRAHTSSTIPSSSCGAELGRVRSLYEQYVRLRLVDNW